MSAQLWDAPVVPVGVTQCYGSASAPLVAGKLVVAGVQDTVGDLVFYDKTKGVFAAADSKTGRDLWHFRTIPQRWNVNPMTELAGGRQYVASALEPNTGLFALTWCSAKDGHTSRL